VGAGQLRLLAVTTAARVSTVPDVPAAAETLPGFDLAPSIFVVAPAGTPPAVVQALNAAVAGAVADSAVREQLAAAGLIAAAPVTPDALAREIAAETTRWSELARASGARLE
ncbi:tripartite tricarboxylate transporter substrate-binding protein, partial [Falsiroseomonas oryzae]|uniref:tripartite tricarboxylate transporter substrate-binding protein n=1 Tax=Falsiroseomonas oryzae TaxID=2766473 RepID=UPI0022EA2E29